MNNTLKFGSFDALSTFIQDSKAKTGIDLLPQYDSSYGQDEHKEDANVETEMTASEKMDQLIDSAKEAGIMLNDGIVVADATKSKVCPHCGKTFTSAILSKKFCSERCRIAFNAKKRLKGTKFHKVCKVCGRHFDTSNHMQTHCEMCISNSKTRKAVQKTRSRKSVNFVTDEMKKAMRVSFVATGLGKDKVYHITATCLHCGQKFNYDAKVFSYKMLKSFCSSKCEYAYRMGKKVK